MGNSVIILAAGDGSRLKSSTPKIFHKIGGLSLIGHVLKTAHDIQSDDIVVVLKPSYSNYDIEFSDDVTRAYQDKPLGTADAANCGFKQLKQTDNEWCFILYGDIPLISKDTLQAMIDMQKTDASVVVLAMDSTGAVGLGKLEPADEEGTIKGIIEAKDASKFDNVIPLCNAGLMIKISVLREFLPKIQPSPVTQEYYLTDIVKLAYRAGYKCRYFQADVTELSGANTREELSILEGYFQNKKRKEIMNKGVSLIAPETVFFAYDTEIENDVTIYPYVYFLNNVQIQKGAQIGPFCVVEGADVADAQVGPFSRLRPGAKIKSGAKVGNFVEIKNSEIGEKSKVNHLSYIGDCEMGSNTNIGAGSITCNYDGFKKHKTKIGNEVFVGSNTALVAPVELEDNVMIGAGSVITKDVKENDLGIARGNQKNIVGYAKKFKDARSK